MRQEPKLCGGLKLLGNQEAGRLMAGGSSGPPNASGHRGCSK